MPPIAVFGDMVRGTVGLWWVAGLELQGLLGLTQCCSATYGLALPWLGRGTTGVGLRWLGDCLRWAPWYPDLVAVISVATPLGLLGFEVKVDASLGLGRCRVLDGVLW